MPPRRRTRKVLVGGLAGTALLVAIALVWLREPRFNDRTTAEWLDTLSTTGETTLHAVFQNHPTRTNLEAFGPRMLPALEREFRRAASVLHQSRTRYMQWTTLWVHLGRLVPNRLGLPQPDRNDVTESVAKERLLWSTCLILHLSPDPSLGLRRLESLAATVPQNLMLEASTAFGALDDDGTLASALVQRIQAPTTHANLRAVWLSCLGRLGPQPAPTADLLRSLTRHPEPAVRRQAIQALGRADTRDDTVGFLQACATDALGRQAVLSALMSMGERARPAEDFIRSLLHDPDMLTALFAKFTLQSLESATQAPPR